MRQCISLVCIQFVVPCYSSPRKLTQRVRCYLWLWETQKLMGEMRWYNCIAMCLRCLRTLLEASNCKILPFLPAPLKCYFLCEVIKSRVGALEGRQAAALDSWIPASWNTSCGNWLSESLLPGGWFGVRKRDVPALHGGHRPAGLAGVRSRRPAALAWALGLWPLDSRNWTRVKSSQMTAFFSKKVFF